MIWAVYMYYRDGLTQKTIASKLGVPRVTITRLLKQAREEGLVRIQTEILTPRPRRFELSTRLEATWGLQNAYVVESHADPLRTLAEIGAAGVHYLLALLRPGLRLGFGWSGTISHMGSSLGMARGQRHVACSVHDLAGHMIGGGNPYSITGKVAEALRVPFEPLAVPVLLQSKFAYDALLEEPSVRSALQNAARCDVAFVGIGAASAENMMVKTGQLAPEEMFDLVTRGAVGEVLLRFYDRSGRPLSTSLDERLMTLDWQALHRIPYVVALAAGANKVPAILGWIRSGGCHCLITDVNTAEALVSQR